MNLQDSFLCTWIRGMHTPWYTVLSLGCEIYTSYNIIGRVINAARLSKLVCFYLSAYSETDMT
jgi:hypothetical protein